MKINVKNILDVLDKAAPTDIDEGRLAYQRYHKVCRDIANYYRYTLPEVISVFAATSPNTDYLKNLRSAVSVIYGHSKGIPVEKIRVATYGHCRNRAYQYLTGEADFLTKVKGKKILSFYMNILNPMDGYAVTIDGHAFNIWRNIKAPLKGAGIPARLYNEIAEDYREVSRRVGLLPNQVQAITWFTWKRLHNVFYQSPQLGLYQNHSADLWRTERKPEDIKPYPLLSETPTIREAREQAKQSPPQNLADEWTQAPLFS